MEARGEILSTNLRPTPPQISVFSSRDPAVLFLKSRSAPPRGEVLLISVFSLDGITDEWEARRCKNYTPLFPVNVNS
jgi:hypothetical protein